MLSSLLICSCIAWSLVNVKLHTDWSYHPLALEVAEQVAQENETSYWKLIDLIASDPLPTNPREVYHTLRKSIQDYELLPAYALHTLDFGIALNEMSVRIQAYYQHYNATTEAFAVENCDVWAYIGGKQYCDVVTYDFSTLHEKDVMPPVLPFDKILGPADAPLVILYADIASQAFRASHLELRRQAAQANIRYALRYKPSPWSTPLSLSGYGAELFLKRTDYLVIDDREALPQSIDNFERNKDDITPLSTAELKDLGFKAASYVLKSDKPLETLRELLTAFPKLAASLAQVHVNDQVKNAITKNQMKLVGEGRLIERGGNAIWLNGILFTDFRLNAFSILEHLRQERRMFSSLTSLGLRPPHIARLLASEGPRGLPGSPQRYNYKDTSEGEKIIIWLNDLEKDKRYATWPVVIDGILDPVYPGQLPAIRRNLHHVILTLDLCKKADQYYLVQQLVGFVHRGVAIRFGIVPIVNERNRNITTLVYYILEAYGMKAMIDFVELLLQDPEDLHKTLTWIEESYELRGSRSLTFQQTLMDEHLESKLFALESWHKRLGLSQSSLVVNGQIVIRGDNWAAEMSSRIFGDLQALQKAVISKEINDDSNLQDFFLANAAERRNTLVTPERYSDVRIINLWSLAQDHYRVWEDIPSICKSGKHHHEMSFVIFADFTSEQGFQLFTDAVHFITAGDGIQLRFVHTGRESNDFTTLLYRLHATGKFDLEALTLALPFLQDGDSTEQADSNAPFFTAKSVGWSTPDKLAAQQFWDQFTTILSDLGLLQGERALLANGRLIGPIPKKKPFIVDDFVDLLTFELNCRVTPVLTTLPKGFLNCTDDCARFDLSAKVSSVVAFSSSGYGNEEIYDSDRSLGRSFLYERWNLEDAGITLGNSYEATINIAAIINPISETAQKWIPMLNTLAEMPDVSIRIYFNPPLVTEELPIKRFYKHVLDSGPKFDSNGSLEQPQIIFDDIPIDALLTLGLDVPPPWVVSPKESEADLDNIRLSSIPDGKVSAIWELRNILIEGHAQDITLGGPPKGVEVILGTMQNSHITDTIIMANLGYFQFKSKPGIWLMDLKKGRSTEIFKFDVDSLSGRNHLSDRLVALDSFTGVTVFPGLSRYPGMENEDVLDDESASRPAETKFTKQTKNFWKFFKTTLSNRPKSLQADINIFSVASGHLYERFLSIMTLSVMKHTKHSVKFWFIENFLSPSFKQFLPHLAREQGFDYELVTYKWPHWLRGQREKQREIWGYKILFLDVLFPLDLNKVIFVDADQIVRADLMELIELDLKGAPYGYTPMCDDRVEMEGFRFWKQGYWKNFLRGRPYHISALYVVDLDRFRKIAAGDRLRGQYQALSADPGSLSNLDQDLPNNMQMQLPIFSLPQEWLWCETWCSDEALKRAKTIDLCNNPLTKEPKLDRARRQIPEWTEYDQEVASLVRRVRGDFDENAVGGKHIADDERTSTLKLARQRTAIDLKDEL